MNSKLLKALFLFLSFISLSNICFAEGIDEKINKGFAPIADAWETLVFTSIPITDKLSIPIVLIVLIGGALFFTFYFSFVNIRK
ncbi:MAG: alanine glycine permease, partial [Oligoflexus sp.]|nr:alanine glycine permease [Pseudopedobacter sp.]